MIDPREELKAYLDNELNPSEAEQVRRAIETDPALAREAEQLQALATALAQETLVQPVGLEATLAKIQRRKVWWRNPAIAWPAAVSVAGAIAMAVFLTMVLLPAGRVPGVRTASFAAAKSEQIQAASNGASADEDTSATVTPMAKSFAPPADRSSTRPQGQSMTGRARMESSTPPDLASPSLELFEHAALQDLLGQLKKLPGFVSVKHSGRGSSGEATVLLVYRDQITADRAKKTARAFEQKSTFTNFGPDVPHVKLKIETAHK